MKQKFNPTKTAFYSLVTITWSILLIMLILNFVDWHKKTMSFNILCLIMGFMVSWSYGVFLVHKNFECPIKRIIMFLTLLSGIFLIGLSIFNMIF